jgi:hypothetical protein
MSDELKSISALTLLCNLFCDDHPPTEQPDECIACRLAAAERENAALRKVCRAVQREGVYVDEETGDDKAARRIEAQINALLTKGATNER